MNRYHALACAGLLLLAGCSLRYAARCGPFPSVSEADCAPGFDYRSVVQIDSGRERSGVYRTRNSGSALLLDTSGLLVTASHVVNGRDRVAVHVGDSVYAARPLPGADDAEADVAFLRISGDGRSVTDGCILSDTLSPCRFPVANVAAGEPASRPFGAEVQVVGFPHWQPTLLRGRIVDPKPRLARYVAHYGLDGEAGRNATPAPLRATKAVSESADMYAGALSLLEERIRDGYLFVELETSGRHAGISGGGVVLAGEAIGMVVESWNSFEKAILICAPLPSRHAPRSQPPDPAQVVTSRELP